jgi:hypothetical protein
MRPDSPLRKFDPKIVARYERDRDVAYYKKDPLLLLHNTVGMVSQIFALPWPPFVFAAYLLTQAKLAFEPFNDIPHAESFIRRFYSLIRHVNHEEFDVERATKLEINWWIVHRKLFGNPENEDLVKALQAMYAEIYGANSEQLYEAARLRAQAILCCDLWVNSGKPANSPLLKQEEEALTESYRALKKAIT